MLLSYPLVPGSSLGMPAVRGAQISLYEDAPDLQDLFQSRLAARLCDDPSQKFDPGTPSGLIFTSCGLGKPMFPFVESILYESIMERSYHDGPVKPRSKTGLCVDYVPQKGPVFQRQDLEIVF